jgi:hypothetical protein
MLVGVQLLIATPAQYPIYFSHRVVLNSHNALIFVKIMIGQSQLSHLFQPHIHLNSYDIPIFLSFD